MRERVEGAEVVEGARGMVGLETVVVGAVEMGRAAEAGAKGREVGR